MAELCRRFGISRKTGYAWAARYGADGAAGLGDRARTPRRSPRLTEEATAERVAAVRAAHPTWGGRKIKRWLEDRGHEAPAASTIARILDRAGPVDPAASAVRKPPCRFVAPEPNALWQMDFKGDFAVGGGRCYPLHILDDHARFVLALAAGADQRGETVQAVLTRAFRQYGLPWRIPCDNGAPWGTTQSESRLTRLGAWPIRLGVAVRHGAPGHPQTQGKLERANRTLGADVLAGAYLPDLPSCQRAFDAWRDCSNAERPHEALGLATPLSVYRPSPRPFPEVLPEIAYDAGTETRKVQADGTIAFRGHELRVSRAVAGERVAVRPTAADGVWEVAYAHQVVRRVDLRGPRPPQIDPDGDA